MAILTSPLLNDCLNRLLFKMNSRALAAKTLTRVVKHSHALDLALEETFRQIDDQKEKSFVQELCYGVMRWYPRLDFLLAQLLEKPLKQKDLDIQMLLMLGIYQLNEMRTPEHAAVSATVDACDSIRKSWAKNLINAVLRRYQREKSQLDAKVNETKRACYAHPDWFIKRMQTDWPNCWSELLGKNIERPPMHLRVNLQQTSRIDYLNELERMNIAAQASSLNDCGITLSSPMPVEELPGFSRGQVSVQDHGAQLAASLLNLSSGLSVLDACAAPGGKTAHIYESEADLYKLTAIDVGDPRIALLQSTKQRLAVKMEIIQADASKVESWWDGELFDRILLDAPCSATGVIRRHPDIKILRQTEQLDSLADTQENLLFALWPLLKQGGRMLYSTCSMFKQENDNQIEKLLNRHDDAEIINIDADWGVAMEFGRQTLPTQEDSDSFYYAVLEKKHA
jgi:16S rRNA (cytosine967-C5)-methyltransferase